METIIKKNEAVRELVKEEVRWFKKTNLEGQRRWMRLAKLVQSVRDGTMWKDWKDVKGRKFATFDHYVESELEISNGKVYSMLKVVDHLKLPMSKLEELGKSKCYELARVAEERPKQLERVLQKVESNPDLTVNQVKDIADAAIENRALERYERMEFAIKEGDIQTILEALAVMQAGEPVENPDSASGRGVHLVNVCREFLSGEEETKVLRQLKKSGYFQKVPFQLEG